MPLRPRFLHPSMCLLPAMDEDIHRDIHLDHRPITPHSCKHCRRVVLRRENCIQLPSRIKLPHTISELRQAIEDGCELILLFASAKQPGHLLVCSGCSDCEDHQASHIRELVERKYTFPLSYGGLRSDYSSILDRLKSLRSLWGHGGFWIELHPHYYGEGPTTYYGEGPTTLDFKYKDLFKMRLIPSVDMTATGVTGVSSNGRNH